ncbi:MAG: type II methionyl aminopeptidase [Candidatus Aenigmarchaeota archaeon]|nr:type II methionyl aminopeptidase [Candidatus Aenigmarchaeota archaeon]
MEETVLKKYLKAGEIAKKAKVLAMKMVEPGVKIIEIAERVENLIKEEGGKPAFPLNISINNVAAHYTPDINDTTVLKEGYLVKIDVGVHVDGYIADTAFTVCVGCETHKLIQAAKQTLEEFLKIVSPGKTVKELSEFVEKKVKEFGVNPVRNLAGHGLERYVQHAEPSIPNGGVNINTKLEKGKVIAMEIFTTDGIGFVKESYPSLIYRYVADKPVRLRESKVALRLARDEFEGMPFAKRWLANSIPLFKINLVLNELLSKGAIIDYPILKERSGGLVAQWEETIILEDEPIVTTKLE